MTSRLRVPGLLDILTTDDPAVIGQLAPDPRLDRDFSGPGPFLNRMIYNRVRRILSAADGPVAGVAPRGDVKRAERQRALKQALDLRLEHGDPAPEHSAMLAEWLRREPPAPVPGQTVQEAIGRLFLPGFVSTPGLWNDAVLLDAAPRSFNPFRRLLWLLTGQPERARRRLSDSVGGDPAAMHAIAVAVHTLVRSLEALRDLWRDPAARTLAPAAAAVRALRAPRSVLRRWTERASTVAGEVRAGSLVRFDLDAANHRHPGGQAAFMLRTWSECPAARWVMALLETVWAQAQRSAAGSAA